MAIEDFFRHKCNIYYAVKTPKNAGYGLPNSEQYISYPDSPSIDDVDCFFNTINTSASITLQEPKNDYTGANQLSLPAGTIINQGDKVVDIRYNLEYTAGFPEDIRGQYIVVPLYRRTEQRSI